jgi:hypothetical protein
VVWQGYDGKDNEIFLYERATGTTLQLTNNDYNDASPQINSNGDVVWSGYDGTDYEIYLYERASGTTLQVTDNNSLDTSPQINGNGDIVWQAYDGSDYEISLSLGIIELEIDIRPWRNPNTINLKCKGVVSVAVLTTQNFDASVVMPYSVTFAGASPVWWRLADVDRDGDMDMLFHFRTQELVELNEDSTEATLTGETSDGMAFKGTDSVDIVSEGAKKKCHKHFHNHCQKSHGR